MYFAFDSCDIEALARSLHERLRTSQGALARETLHWFALVDGAFDHGQRKPSWQPQTVSIYQADGNLAALKEVSPYLVALPKPDQIDFEKTMRKLLRHCNGRPMLSFLACRTDALALRAQWQNCLMLKMQDDGEPYLLRFADTRVLPALATLPSKAIWQTLTQNLKQWIVINRAGELVALPIEPVDISSTTIQTTDQNIELSQKDLQHLLSCGLADSVIDAMAEQLPELLPEQKRAGFYVLVSQACALAEQHHVEAFPDVVALAVASQLTQGEILGDKRVLAVLSDHQWPSGQLSDALIDYLPEEIQ
jgi:Domain of unknown function (DUF4123)